MRQRSGTRTEHANRKTPPTRLTATAVATAACLVAAPATAAGAAPVTSGPAPDEVDGPLQPGTPVVAEAVSSTSPATGSAATDTEVREIDVPDAPDAAAPPAGDAADVVARVHRRSTDDFALVALTWQPGTAPDDVEVQVRTHGARGWSPWADLHHHAAEGPAPGEESDGLRDGTEPLWVDEADGVQARVLSATGTAPDDVQVALVDPGSQSGVVPAVAYPVRSRSSVVPAVLRTTSPTRVSATTVASSRPRLITRRQWGADPRLRGRCDSPRVANTMQMAFVHHTAGSNRYSRSEAPSIVRGVYAYHTQGRGWCDIGYNFLVDRFGRSYVGRAGGPNVAVRGAHAGDYNVRTTGVSLIGNFEKARPTKAMKAGLTRLLAWKLGSFYRGPRTTVRIEGSRFEKISGHRDAMSTACPGRYVYRWLPRLRDRVANRMDGVQTPISRKWKRLRSNGEHIGQPHRGEANSANGGRKTEFGRGWILWHDRTGAHHVAGAIRRRYRQWGLAQGRMGYPRTDTWQIKSHRGVAQTFQHGRIYRSPGNGADGVWGRINRRYRRTGLASGRLGVPVRNQYRTKGGWAAGFEHGRITWNTSTGRTRVRTY